jgi:hypothetical protein
LKPDVLGTKPSVLGSSASVLCFKQSDLGLKSSGLAMKPSSHDLKQSVLEKWSVACRTDAAFDEAEGVHGALEGIATVLLRRICIACAVPLQAP